MGNQNDHRQPGNRPLSAADLSRQVYDAHTKVLDVERRLQDIEQIVNDKNQWNNTVRGWIGTSVVVQLVTGEVVKGVLKGLDRYTLCIRGSCSSLEMTEEREFIVHKGAITLLCQQ